MTTYTITSGYDTYTLSSGANSNYATSPTLAIDNTFAGVTAYTYVYFPLPDDLIGQTISSATLGGHAATTLGSAVTVRARLITSAWSDSTATYNRAPTVGTAFVDTALAAPVVGAAANIGLGTLIQSVASGQAWLGIRLENTTAGTGYGFQSFESGVPNWSLTIVATDAPEVPQALVPNGTVVGSGKPILSCDFTDNGGLSNDMAAIQVQIDPAQNGTTPAFDSGTVASTLPILDLTTTSYAGLASGATTYWRVQVQDTDGLWSGWSAWAGMTYTPKTTLTLLTPASGVMYDPTSDIIASTSTNMSAYRVQVTSGTDQTDVKFDTGITWANPAALTTIDVPLPQEYQGSRILVDNSDYQLHIQAWDQTLTRQATPGLPVYAELWSTFHFDNDLTVLPVTTLTADQDASPGPGVVLTWTRGAAGDAWVVYRDGKVLKRLDPADTIAGVSTWSWTDPHPKPWIQHDYQVAAISSGKAGDKGPTASIIPDLQGVWLVSDYGTVVLWRTDTSQLTTNSRLDTYKPINLRYDVDIVSGLEGISGTITGVIMSDDDGFQDHDAAKATLLSIRDNPASTVKLVFGNFSGTVLLRNLSVIPDAVASSVVPVSAVSFQVNQVSDFDSVL